MWLLSNFFNFFTTLPGDKEIIANEIRKSNFTRILVISSLGIPVTLAHIFLFGLNLYHGTATDILWRKGIISSHTVMLVVLGVTLVTSLHLRKQAMELSLQAGRLVIIVFVAISIWGVACVSIDQLVTPSITAFILTMLVAATGLLLSPIQAVWYFSFSYLLFVAGILWLQPDPDLRLTNLMNGFSSAISCFGISVIFWKNNLIRYRQSRLIEHQKEELVKKNDALALSNATKDKFFSIISHDLRGPISGTLSLAQLMSNQDEPENPEEQKYMVNLLRDNLGNAYNLLENLLYWSETQTGSIRFNPEVISIKRLIDNNIALLSAGAKGKNLTMVDNADDDKAWADKEMLDTVLRNLLSNAIKFSFDGGAIEVSSRFINSDGRLMIEVCVKDEGTGIQPTLLNSLFRIDKKVSLAGTRQENGTGLGLILCKEFIEKNGGAISAKNNSDKGSSFIFTVPATD